MSDETSTKKAASTGEPPLAGKEQQLDYSAWSGSVNAKYAGSAAYKNGSDPAQVQILLVKSDDSSPLFIQLSVADAQLLLDALPGNIQGAKDLGA